MDKVTINFKEIGMRNAHEEEELEVDHAINANDALITSYEMSSDIFETFNTVNKDYSIIQGHDLVTDSYLGFNRVINKNGEFDLIPILDKIFFH